MSEARLGQLANATADRDAIHVAVYPVVAPMILMPGQHVDRHGDPKGKLVGIVDPFLKAPVQKGERFFLCVYPGTIMSLRHQWSHAEIDRPEPASRRVNLRRASAKGARAWIEKFADRLGYTYEELMHAAQEWLIHREYWHDDNENYKLVDESEWKTFWLHHETLTGQIPPEQYQECFFSCSC